MNKGPEILLVLLAALGLAGCGSVKRAMCPELITADERVQGAIHVLQPETQSCASAPTSPACAAVDQLVPAHQILRGAVQ